MTSFSSAPRHSSSGFNNLAIELYASEDSFYVFDANRVVFLDVDKRVFAILGLLRDQILSADELRVRLPQYSEKSICGALQEIERLQQRGYLLSMQSKRFSPLKRSEFEETLSKRMTGFTALVTTQCNLACSYCIFGGDYQRHPGLSQTAMTWETARNMVDFLVKHSKESETVNLDFFGGEPMLEFALIKQTVEYLKASLKDDKRQVSITIASNGTVFSNAIMQFFLDHKVYVQFSIDGESIIHNRERRFRTGDRGSYDIVMNNLQRIHDDAPDYFDEFIRIKSVITMDSLSEAESEFWELPLIKQIVTNNHESLLIQEPHYDAEQDGSYFAHMHEIFDTLHRYRGVTTLDELTENLNWRQRAFYDQTFALFMDVQAVNQLRSGAKRIPFSKGCLMGCQEGVVQPNGDIGICHKSSSIIIGNVNRGEWDFDRIWNLHKLLFDEWPECSSCFAARFCDLCYEKLDGVDDRWVQTRSKFCDFTRFKYHLIFTYMLKILDRNPELWKDMRVLVNETLARKMSKKSDRQV